MKKVYKSISLVLALILSIILIPYNEVKANTYLGNTGRGVDVGGWTGADGTTTRPIMIPPFNLNGITAYCCQLPLDFPVNYSYPAPTATDNYVYKGIALGGYPADILGLKSKYGLSNLQAEQYTQYALWKLTGGTADRRHPYVDELISIVNSKNYGAYSNIGFSLKNTTITMDRNNGYQESNTIESVGSPGTFTFPSNSNVWSVDINGNKKDTFNIGENFKLRALLTYDGTFEFTIQVKLKEPTAIIYKGNGVIQDLLSFEWKERLEGVKISAEFKAYGNVSITKTDERGNMVANVGFGIYSDNAANNLVKDGTTNSEGILYLSDLRVGTYYVKELSVPQGYTLSNEIKQVNIEAEKTATMSWQNKIIKGNASLLKIDSGNANGLSNVLFKIKSLSGFDKGKTWEIKSDENGLVKLQELSFGDYEIQEIMSNEGYILNSKPIKFSISKDGETIQLQMSNDRIKGTVRMLKVDSVSGLALPGATFRISCTSGFDKGKTWELISDENGYIKLDNAQYGYYTIQEIKTVDGYVIQPEMLHFNIDENNEVIELKMTNDRILGTVQLIKYDAESGRPLSNADFSIECTEGFARGVTYRLKSDEDGLIKANLEYGKYMVTEIKAPNGYILNTEPIPFDIKENGQLIELKMNNERVVGNVQLIKIDTVSNQPLANADFTITCDEGFSKGETYNLKSDNNGIIKIALKYGKYSIVEVKAPTGYILNNEIIPFEITENGQNIELNMSNDRIKGTVELIKIDSKTGNTLPNAEFKITGLDGFGKDKTYNLTSNEKGIINAELEFGKYIIEEVKAPDGYVLNNEQIPFEINENGQKISLNMSNDRIKGIMELLKIDTEIGKPLSDAEFIITCIDGFAKGQTYNLVSEKDGAIKYELEYGKYEIVEVRSPLGYILNNEKISFEVNENGQKIELNINNDRIKGSIKIKKVDADTKRPLSNVKFKLTCLEGFMTGETLEYITDIDGIIKVDNVQFGKYRISEIQTIDGYVMDTRPIEFEIYENHQTVEFTVENKIYTGTVVLKKIDEDTKAALKGIKFELYKGDYLVGEYETDENGEIKVENLSFGQYYFKEIATIEGYVFDNESYWNFGIVENKTEITITVTNRKIKSKIEFSKLDSYTGTLLPGAKMLLRGIDPNNDIYIEFTTENQPSIFELPYGNYEIIELEAPEGYVLNSTPTQVSVIEDNLSIATSLNNLAISYGK